MRLEEWLLIEWPEGQAKPAKYFLTTAPEEAALAQMVLVTKMRSRIERDYQDLKWGFGLAPHEGRGWRGFHHHPTLSISTYGFLMAQGLDPGRDVRGLPFPSSTSLGAVPRGQRHVPDSITTLRLRLSVALANTLGHSPSGATRMARSTLVSTRTQAVSITSCRRLRLPRGDQAAGRRSTAGLLCCLCIHRASSRDLLRLRLWMRSCRPGSLRTPRDRR